MKQTLLICAGIFFGYIMLQEHPEKVSSTANSILDGGSDGLHSLSDFVAGLGAPVLVAIALVAAVHYFRNR